MTLPAKGVLLDLDNTIVDREGAFAAWLAEKDQLSVADRARARELDDGGHGSRQPLCEFLGSRLNLDWREAWAEVRDGIAAAVPPAAAGVALALRALAEKIPIAVVTNGGVDNQMKKLERSGLRDVFGDRVVVSAAVGFAKPAREIFEAGLRTIHCEAKDAVFVGDSRHHDIDGARAAGMKTVWVGGDPESDAADRVISSLAELPEVLEL